jgi:myo-inositol-1(or 4)-monophosphatase
MKETTDQILTFLKIAETAAHKAGDYLLNKIGKAKVKHQKSALDDLLDADLEAEQILLTELREETPHMGILSEEIGHQGRQDHYWIIDPLDGSANFQHGNPAFAVAIALVIDQTTQGSVILLPASHETFTAIHKQGAYLNGTPITVSDIAALDKAVVHIGDPQKEGNLQITNERLKDLLTIAPKTRRIRMIGSAATDLAYVASGRAEALINYAKSLWDIEAGKLLLIEAGGKVTTKQRDNGEILSIYSNGYIHQAINDLFATKHY